jgi:hypothetical protein
MAGKLPAENWVRQFGKTHENFTIDKCGNFVNTSQRPLFQRLNLFKVNRFSDSIKTGGRHGGGIARVAAQQY